MRPWMVVAVGMLVGLAQARGDEELNRRGKERLSAQGSFQEELSGLLDEKFRLDWGLAQGDAAKRTDTLEAAGYSIRFPTQSDCNPWPELLRQAKYRRALETQVDEAAAFLTDYHFRMLGRNTPLFKIRRIVLCTASRYWRHPALHYDRLKAELTLRVGPTRLWLVGNGPITRDNLNPLTAAQIKAKWKAGEQWEQDTLKKEVVDRRRNPIRGHWPLIDPIGETQVLLREGWRRAGYQSETRLQEWHRLGTQELRQRLHARAQAARAEGAALAHIEGLSAEQLALLTQAWIRKVADVETAEAAAAASLNAALKRRIAHQRDTQVYRRQLGFINIENFHQIDVSLTSTEAKEIEGFLVVPENVDISVTQIGIVNVSTTDQVDVRLALAKMIHPDALEKAALRLVLR